MGHRNRMRMIIEPDTSITAAGETGRFHAVIVLQNTPTGDGRVFESISWRDLPLPLMATDESDHGYVVVAPTVLIGNFDTITLQGDEVHGWGSYLANPDPRAAELIALVQSGELRGISADLDAIELEVLFPVEPDSNEEIAADDDGVTTDGDVAEGELPTEEIDGQEYVVMPMMEPILRFTEARLMGATVVPFPALQEAYIEPDSDAPAAAPADDAEPALAASAAQTFAHHHVTGVMLTGALTAAATLAPARGVDGPREGAPARFEFPDIPPADWFDVPEPPGPMPLTITDDGQVFGHLAVWGECHIGLAGECVEPPASASNYARFHLGEIPVDDGGRVSVGHLTFHTGHADLSLAAEATRRHYDDTGTVAADIRAVDGEYGIWCCGAMRSGLTSAQVREIMSAPPSGDWRRYGRDLELVAALSVNVPGFPVLRASAAAPGMVRMRRDEGLTASLIVVHPATPAQVKLSPEWLTAAGLPASMHNDADTTAYLREAIAMSIGRGRKDRMAALAARVHGGN